MDSVRTERANSDDQKRTRSQSNDRSCIGHNYATDPNAPWQEDPIRPNEPGSVTLGHQTRVKKKQGDQGQELGKRLGTGTLKLGWSETKMTTKVAGTVQMERDAYLDTEAASEPSSSKADSSVETSFLASAADTVGRATHEKGRRRQESRRETETVHQPPSLEILRSGGEDGACGMVVRAWRKRWAQRTWRGKGSVSVSKW